MIINNHRHSNKTQSWLNFCLNLWVLTLVGWVQAVLIKVNPKDKNVSLSIIS